MVSCLALTGNTGLLLVRCAFPVITHEALVLTEGLFIRRTEQFPLACSWLLQTSLDESLIVRSSKLVDHETGMSYETFSQLSKSELGIRLPCICPAKLMSSTVNSLDVIILSEKTLVLIIPMMMESGMRLPEYKEG